MRARRGLLLLFALLTLAAPAAAQWRTERAVLLSRHGVRAPTAAPDALAPLAASPWPAWPVGPGELTTRGADLARRMGAWYRAHFAAAGLLAAESCPPASAVHAWADVDQRTRLTAEALLDGMFPRCGIVARHQAALDRPDPLFHPTRAGVCPVDAARARAAVLGRIGGGFAAIEQAYAPVLARLQAILCPRPAPAGCGLFREPSALHPSRGGEGVRLAGPIAIGSTVAEIFLLETGQGLPRGRIAWGRLRDAADLTEVFRVHTLQFDLMDRTPYLARRHGSNLLRRLARDVAATDGPALVLYVGHDTNIANVAGLLGLDWALAGYQPNQTPPGGSLIFEVLRADGASARFVRLSYAAQTPDQLADARALTLADPPARAALALPGCAEAAQDGACPLERFVALADQAVDPACLGPPP